jgi:hypothetical protein
VSPRASVLSQFQLAATTKCWIGFGSQGC